MEQTSKELVRGLFEHKNVNRIPFIPWVCSFAAKLEQVPIQTMLSDGGVLARALINAHKLFGYDAIVNAFDTSLEAEACGCQVDWSDASSLPKVISHPLSEGASVEDINTSEIEKQGRVPAVLEATKRLNIIKGKDVAIAGVITGPLTLGSHLKGEAFIEDLNKDKDEALDIIEAAGSIGLKLCRAYCETGVDLIVIAEEMLGQLNPEMVQVIASPLRSIWNVASFYNVYSIALSKGCSTEHIEPVLDLQADGITLSGNIDNTLIKEKALERNCCFARSIPDSALLDTAARAGDAARECLSIKEKGLFLSTEWEVPYTTDVNAMHEVMSVIRGAQDS